MDDNVPQEMLPFFEGMNGSNQNQKFTCVLVLNLNHFESRDYNNKALILDARVSKIRHSYPHWKRTVRPLRLPHLSCDVCTRYSANCGVVQLIFRSALHRHGEDQKIELWLL